MALTPSLTPSLTCAPCITDLALVRDAATMVGGTACCPAHAVLLTYPQDNQGRRRARLAQLRELAEAKAATAQPEEQAALELLLHEYTLAGAMDMGGQPRPDGSPRRERGQGHGGQGHGGQPGQPSAPGEGRGKRGRRNRDRPRPDRVEGQGTSSQEGAEAPASSGAPVSSPESGPAPESGAASAPTPVAPDAPATPTPPVESTPAPPVDSAPSPSAPMAGEAPGMPEVVPATGPASEG